MMHLKLWYEKSVTKYEEKLGFKVVNNKQAPSQNLS